MNQDAEFTYADIIHLPHHVSKKHPQMSMADRAAQFSPFAALHGTQYRYCRGCKAPRRTPEAGLVYEAGNIPSTAGSGIVRWLGS